MFQRKRLAAVAAAAAIGLSGLVVASAPIASAAPPDASASAQPPVTMDALPTVQINGIVWAQVTVGNTVYAVGNFSTARPAGSPAGQNEVQRANILAYDIRTGVLDTGFVHTLNAQAQTIAASPDGSRIYIGGTFTRVDGKVRARIAAFSTSDGSLLPYNPQVDATVSSIAVSNGNVFFAGNFSSVNGNTRLRIAATTLDGALTAWAPTASGAVRGIAPTADASRVYLGGSFNSVNGQPSRGVAAVDGTTGAYVPVPAASAIAATSTNANGLGVYSLKTFGNVVYGTGFNFASAGNGQLEGTFALDASSGSVVWVNDCWGDSYDAAVVAGSLFVASHAHNCSAAGYFGEYSAKMFGLAYSLSPTSRYNVRDSRGWDWSGYHTSQLQQWYPAFTYGDVQGQSVWSFTGNGDYVAAGGEFPAVNGKLAQGLTRFATHANAPNQYGPTAPGTPTVSSLAQAGSVPVTVPAAYDPDDAALTYQLFRDGDLNTPVATTTAPTVGFWQQSSQPNPVTLTDTGATAGVHTYTVRVSDGSAGQTSPTTSVTVGGANLALGRAASQSSTSSGGAASQAVDGTTATVTQTRSDTYSWWQVDLGQSRSLSSIRIFNRSDSGASRLSNYSVFVSNTPFDTRLSPSRQAAAPGVWTNRQTTRAGTPTAISAPVTGRYVMIQQNSLFQSLSLAEVQVLGG